jgi:hypothetical protein
MGIHYFTFHRQPHPPRIYGPAIGNRIRRK